MRSTWGPDLSFETLKSKFDCITTKFFFVVVMQTNLDFKVSNERSGPHELIIRHI